MATYRVILKDPSDGTLWELLPISYSFVEELNKEPIAKITLSFNELDRLAEIYSTTVMAMFSAAIRELYIERDGTKIFYGVVSDLGVETAEDGKLNFVVKAVGFFGLFVKRIAGIPKRVFSSTDAGTIAWTLIDESQDSDTPYSDWGITQGSITSSVNRDRTYRFDYIKDSIIRLSNENLDDGFDFDIDNNKQFNIYYPTKGASKPNIIFDDKTLDDYRWRKPLILGLTNKVYALGEGFNDDVLYVTRTAATAYRTPFGTLEEALRETDIKTTATLNAKGDRKLADEKEPIIDLEGYHYDGLNFGFDDYNLGDTVVVDLPKLDLDEESKRVKQREFTVGEKDSVAFIKILLE